METMNFFEPNDEVFNIYNACAESIAEVLPTAEVTLIGSWAVPMLGRAEIDIMIISDDVESAQKALETVKFSSGPIINEEGFAKNRVFGDFVCEAHILHHDHPKRKYYLWAIEQLKNDESLRIAYTKMKKSMQGKSIEEYRRVKRYFLYNQTQLGWKGFEKNY